MATTVLKRLSKLFKRKPDDFDQQACEQNQDYALNTEYICPKAFQVVSVLKENNFQAHLVGGCIRDLLLDKNPKDFDVATNAKPHEVKALFKRSRIVGRRFQIVHVPFGRDIIEVTTFRSNSPDKIQSSRAKRHLQQSASGLLTRDNVFGSIKEDAHRRDLTINALYYDPVDNKLSDFCEGLKDLQDRKIRIIGDPALRYREDPVRLLRVIRFTAKLGFEIEPKTLKPIAKLAQNLSHVSAPRMFDETLKLFMSGYGLTIFKLLRRFGLFAFIIPQTSRIIEQGDNFALRLVEQAFENTDLRICNKQRVTPAFIYAALLWPSVNQCGIKPTKQRTLSLDGYKQGGKRSYRQSNPHHCYTKTLYDSDERNMVVTAQVFPEAVEKEQKGSLNIHVFEQPMTLFFFEQAGENLDGLGNWWTQYQQANELGRQEMVRKIDMGRSKNPDSDEENPEINKQ